MNVFLTIAVPTYNRINKLERLVRNINEQFISFPETIEILISDNCSTDGTAAFLDEINFGKTNFIKSTFKQSNNIGFDGNILFLYNNSRGKYIWFFADDDLLLPGSISKIVDSLKTFKPNVLRFSFGQPPGSRFGVFNFEEKFHLVENKKEIVELSAIFPKISTYILEKTNLIHEDLSFISKQDGFGWMHLVLSYSVFNTFTTPKLLIISNVLAECDDDFDMLTWSPNVIKNSFQTYKHKFIENNNPEYLEIEIKSAYINSIQFCFAAKIGALRVLNMSEYDLLVSNLNFSISLLFKPKSFLQLVLLKFKLIKVYLYCKKIIS